MPSVCAPSTSSGYGSTSVYAAGLQGEQADLRAVSVRDHELVLALRAARGSRRAVATLARWILCRRAARPVAAARCPRVRRPLASSAPERGDHDRLDRVHAVLRLVEDDGSVRLEDLVGDLEASSPNFSKISLAHRVSRVVERRQAVHELHVRVAAQRPWSARRRGTA